MQEVAEFRMPKSVLYGRNSIEKLGEQSKKFGKRAFIVTDTIMEKLGYVERCIKQLN
ncbi:UNVERIFIED_CONTAM: iron-containing alcohol dehydrogenase, partial [Bacillus mycoides]